MPTLIEAQPINTATGSRVTLRACSTNDRRFTALGSNRWWPAISEQPSLGIQLFNGDFTSDVTPGNASFTLRLDQLANLDGNVRGYSWSGAPVTIYYGDDPGAWPWTALFTGKVQGHEQEGNALKLTANVDQSPFEKDALYLSYAGTTGLEGDANLKGTPKPWVFGIAKNVEPVQINATDYIFQVSAYGAIKAVDALYERGGSFGASVGDYASLANLLAASIPEGRWGTCLASGLIRLGAPPYGVITADVQGDFSGSVFRETTGAIIERVTLAAGVSAGAIDSASLAALDVAVPYPVNIYLREQESVLSLARRMAKPCNAQAGVGWTGKLFAVRVAIGTPALTLDAQGKRLPRVWSSVESDTSPPYKRIEFTADRCWRVHTLDEIAFDMNLIERGEYDAATVYREGNIVSLPDGSRWVYVNATPTSGNFPATGVYWSNIETAYGADPNTLTPAEKRSWAVTDQERETRYTTLLASANAAALTDEATAATTARTTYQTYRNGLSPAWNDYSQSTTIVRATHMAALDAWGLALDTLAAAVSNATGISAGHVDPHFDRGLGGVNDGWSLATGFSINATAGKDGGPALVADATAAGGAMAQRKVHRQAARQGERWVATFRVKMETAFNATTTQFRLRLREMDKDYALLTSHTLADVTAIDAKGARDAWHEFEVTVTLSNANTRFADGSVVLEAAPTAGKAYVDYFDAKKIVEQTDNAAVASMPALPAQVIRRDSAGAIKAGELSRTVNATRFKGSTDVTATGTTWSRTASSGITSSINASSGVLTITAVTAPGTITVTSARSGEPTLSQPVTVDFLDDAPASSGNNNGAESVQLTGTISSTSYSTFGSAIAITSNASGEIAWSYTANLSGTGAVPKGKVQYRLVSGGGYSDISGSETVGSATISGEPGSGVVSDSGTLTGLTASTAYYLRWQGARASGSGDMTFLLGKLLGQRP